MTEYNTTPYLWCFHCFHAICHHSFCIRVASDIQGMSLTTKCHTPVTWSAYSEYTLCSMDKFAINVISSCASGFLCSSHEHWSQIQQSIANVRRIHKSEIFVEYAVLKSFANLAIFFAPSFRISFNFKILENDFFKFLRKICGLRCYTVDSRLSSGIVVMYRFSWKFFQVDVNKTLPDNISMHFV